MALVFPTQIFNPRSIKISVLGRTIQSPPSISGVGQIVRTDGGGYRVCQMSGIVLNTNDKLRAWNAWEGVMQGGVTKITVPIATQRLAPRGLRGGTIARYGSLHKSSADPYFPEAIAYGSPLVVAEMVSSAAHRATTVTIVVTRGGRVRGGETFSINHSTAGNHPYKIARVISRDEQEATVLLDMPLRQSVTAGQDINFDWPLMDAVLMPDVDIFPDISFVGAETSITFREYI